MRTSLLVFGDAATEEQSSVKMIIIPKKKKKATIETSLKAVGIVRNMGCRVWSTETRGVLEI